MTIELVDTKYSVNLTLCIISCTIYSMDQFNCRIMQVYDSLDKLRPKTSNVYGIDQNLQTVNMSQLQPVKLKNIGYPIMLINIQN